MKDLTITTMHKNHIPEIIEIERVSFSTPWSELSFINEIYNPNSTAYVALSDTTVVGYIWLKQIKDEGHILNLAVHPKFRRQGIAKVLVSKALETFRANKCNFIYLEVRVSNIQARKLYEDFGFKPVGIRKNYYILPLEDAVIMLLQI